MIVPMKKVSLVVLDKEHEISLDKLRESGVLHLEKKNVASVKLNELFEKKSKHIRALGILNKYTKGNNNKKKSIHLDSHTAPEENLIIRILSLSDEKKILHEQLINNMKEKRRVEAWGEFDPHTFNIFKTKGITLIPYEFSIKEYNALNPEVKLIIISREKKRIKAFALDEAISGITPFSFPALPLSHIENRMDNIKQRVADIESELVNYSVHIKYIENENLHLQEEIEFECARAGLEAREDASVVTWINGYIPHDRIPDLKQVAAKNDWALLVEDISDTDRPPTLIKNNAAIRIIQPVFSFLGTVPGYREYDISSSYLVFLCLFFAMIFGDAGYGVLLLIASVISGFLFLKKSKKKNKSAKFPDAAKLFILLSFCTIVWGSITGSWFAIPSEKLPHFLNSLIINPFNSSGPLAEFPLFLKNIFKLPVDVPSGDLKTRWNIQFLCFTVGIIQILWARGKNVIKQLPSLVAVSQAGWLLMMAGLYFLVLFMILKVPFPPYAIWMIGIGLGIYFIFAEQKGGNFFKNILKSLTNFLSIFLTAVGSFADIISYIRLFAVGLAGGIIAKSFNDMAVPIEGFGGIGVSFFLRLLACVLILAVGHSLNIVMNALSVIVHGVRLNLLEYAGNHLGMEWSGYAYKPFAVMQKKIKE